MKYCPNPSCPHRLRIRSAAEFLDSIVVCSDCGTSLVGEAELQGAEAAMAQASRASRRTMPDSSRLNPREDLDEAFGIARGRARGAIIALAIAAGTRAVQLLATVWQSSQAEDVPTSTYAFAKSLVWFAAIADLVSTVVAGVMFLRWLLQILGAADSMSARAIPWTSRDVLRSFFIPVVNLVRPYQVVRDLHDQLSPTAVPEPAPRPRMDGVGDYRRVILEQAPPPRDLPHACIGAWWALFVVSRLLGLGPGTTALETVLVDVMAIAAAFLAVLVVRALQGRLAERYRRVRYASDEELEAWGIGESSLSM